MGRAELITDQPRSLLVLELSPPERAARDRLCLAAFVITAFATGVADSDQIFERVLAAFPERYKMICLDRPFGAARFSFCTAVFAGKVVALVNRLADGGRYPALDQAVRPYYF